MLSLTIISGLVGCSNEKEKKEKVDEYVPKNVEIYGNDKKTVEINKSIFIDTDGILDSEGYVKSNSSSLTNYFYRLLLNDVYNSKEINEKVNKIYKATVSKNKNDISKEGYEEYVRNKIKTEYLLADYFEKELESTKSIKTYDVTVEYYLKSNEGEKEKAKQIIESNMSDKEYLKQYGKERLLIKANLDVDTKYELLNELNRLNSKKEIKVNDVFDIIEPSNIYDEKLKEEKQEFGMYVKIKGIKDVKLIPENRTQTLNYFADKEFADSEIKYYKLIKFMDDNSKTYDLPKYVYKYMAHETLTNPSIFTNRLYFDQAIFSDLFNNKLREEQEKE